MGQFKSSFRFFRRLFFIVILFYMNSKADGKARTQIPIGVIHSNSEFSEKTIRSALELHKKEYSNPDYKILIDVINTADVFKLSKLMCGQLGRGHLAMVLAVNPDSFSTLHSYSNTFNMPIVASSFPEKLLESGNGEFSVSLLPDYHRAVVDTIRQYKWKEVIYIYDSDEGFMRLQKIYKSFLPGAGGRLSLTCNHVWRVSSADEVVTLLRQVEKEDPWGIKKIIMDSSAILAKSTIVAHVHDVALGRRTYHYLFSGLVMDETWEKNVLEYGSINTTGFRIMDRSANFVNEVLSRYIKMATLPAYYALLFDAVHVLMATYEHIQKTNPALLNWLLDNNSSSRYLDCEQSDVTKLRDGATIMEKIKTINIQGLTGKISFDERGIRKDISLQVVRNNPTGDFLPIGVWHSNSGLKLFGRNTQSSTSSMSDNRTYRVVSMLEVPFYTLDKSGTYVDGSQEVSGLYVDVVNYIAQKLDLDIIFQVAKDGQGWDDLIGQLKTKESDMVITSLNMPETEKDDEIEYSNAFFDIETSCKTGKTNNEGYYFIKPFSEYTWLMFAVTVLGVSMVLFLVSLLDTYTENPARTDQHPAALTTTTVNNEFSYINSVLFILGSVMRRGSNLVPRSFAGRIVCGVWSHVAVLFICQYVAMLTSQMTLEGIPSQFRWASNYLQLCPKDINNNRRSEANKQTCDNEDAGTWANYFCPKELCPVRTSDIMITRCYKNFKTFRIAFRKGSKIRVGVNLALSELNKDREFLGILEKWLARDDCVSEPVHGVLTMDKMYGLFYFLIAGCTTSILVKLMEQLKLLYWKTAANKSKEQAPEAPHHPLEETALTALTAQTARAVVGEERDAEQMSPRRRRRRRSRHFDDDDDDVDVYSNARSGSIQAYTGGRTSPPLTLSRPNTLLRPNTYCTFAQVSEVSPGEGPSSSGQAHSQLPETQRAPRQPVAIRGRALLNEMIVPPNLYHQHIHEDREIRPNYRQQIHDGREIRPNYRQQIHDSLEIRPNYRQQIHEDREIIPNYRQQIHEGREIRPIYPHQIYEEQEIRPIRQNRRNDRTQFPTANTRRTSTSERFIISYAQRRAILQQERLATAAIMERVFVAGGLPRTGRYPDLIRDHRNRPLPLDSPVIPGPLDDHANPRH